MNNFNFNLFKYFYYVAYYKGFTNASKNLNIAQSALSYNIKTLENQIDRVLIIRNSKNFELTEYGYNLYENLKSVFGILNQNLKQINNEFVYEEITIGVRHYLSDFIFKDAIKDFTIKYPNIHLNLKLYSKLDIKKYEEEYDAVIDYIDYVNLIENDQKIKICELNNIIVSGKDLYKQYENINNIKDLNRAKFISMCPSRKNGKFQNFCFNNDVLFTDIVSMNDSVLCKKLIKDNIGLCLVNEENVKEELVAGEIKKINIEEIIFKDEIVLVYKNNKKVNNINKLINIIKDQYKEVV